ncbi:hypothetical protein [Actinoplanes sp. NBRC 101535]|uniref:hypothetical protein n=1 Tax=Actinoplanes sp. NBRC 101535 TaxID=3032196 RepID=UPI0024A261A6|nr:hypothetical protein [Actinoplanes sp. NBRC 101535]GLY08588.1 hypothetical protein Acsp01_89670 [Actinoplanes sp. NBRC 101535]
MQLADGRLPDWHADRIQTALLGVVEQARQSQSRLLQASAVPVDGSERTAALSLLRVAGDELVTLERLADTFGLGVDDLRQLMLRLENAGLLLARRAGSAVSVDELRIHSRFVLTG